MWFTTNVRFLLVLILLTSCCLVSHARRGGGGSRGGSRGSSSRGSSSRGSSSSSSSSRGSTIERNRNRDRTYEKYPSAPAPPPKPPSAPAPPKKPLPKPTVQPYRPSPDYKPHSPKPPTSGVSPQPAYNPNFKESSIEKQPPYNPNYPGQPPPYSPGQGAPPPYSPAGHPGLPSQHAVVPPYSPGAPPPPYTPGRNPYPQPPYPVQPGSNLPGSNRPYPVQPGVNPPYPVQPGSNLPGSNRPYPVQPGYPQSPGGHRPYPVQPGMNYPYPRQPGVPHQPLGSRVWTPNSGAPSPVYMQSGGLPTGGNMYGKPHKKKGFLGSLFSMGSSKHKAPKTYLSHPSPYSGSKPGMTAAMYTILPYMAAKKSKNLFRRPSFGMPMFIPYHSFYYHHHHGFHGDGAYSERYYNLNNENYEGRCSVPLNLKHASINCISTTKEARCEAKCFPDYHFPDNSTRKDNICWHVTGIWRPTKNFPDCQPSCNESCLNGGTCVKPGLCSCPAEYRGHLCQHYFLNCDIRKMAKGNKISWTCTHTKNGSTCRVRCRDALEFETPAAEEYKCSPTGVWTPETIPQCVNPDEKKELITKLTP